MQSSRNSSLSPIIEQSRDSGIRRQFRSSQAAFGTQPNSKIEINMNHLRGNAIPTGPVQYPLSDCDEILCH